MKGCTHVPGAVIRSKLDAIPDGGHPGSWLSLGCPRLRQEEGVAYAREPAEYDMSGKANA